MKTIYKIINSVLVITLIPVLLFLPMFRFIMTIGLSSSNQLVSLIGGIFSQSLDIESIIGNATGIDIKNMPEFYKITDLYDLFFAEKSTFSTAGIDATSFPEELINYFTAAGILFISALVVGVIILVLGIFTKKKILTGAFGIVGFACTFSANKCFTHVASQLVSGKMSLVPVIEKIEALSSYSTYLKLIDIDIRIFELSSAYTMMLIIFGAIAIVNLGFYLYESTVTK